MIGFLGVLAIGLVPAAVIRFDLVRAQLLPGSALGLAILMLVAATGMLHLSGWTGSSASTVSAVDTGLEPMYRGPFERRLESWRLSSKQAGSLSVARKARQRMRSSP